MKKDDKYHIEQLQNLVCYLSEIYRANKWEFTEKHEEKQFNGNGPLSEKEWDEITRFHKILPRNAEDAVRVLARLEIPRKIDWQFLYRHLEKRGVTKKIELFGEKE